MIAALEDVGVLPQASAVSSKPWNPSSRAQLLHAQGTQPWYNDGPKPQSLVTMKPDCYGVGMRMKLPNGHRVVLPLGRLTSAQSS